MAVVAPVDARLVAADPAVPGLAEVLCPLELARSLGWAVADAQIRYVRYKPGTSMVAGLRMRDLEGGTFLAQALAVTEEAAPKLDKIAREGENDDVGRGSAVDVRRGVAVADATADRHLPGIRNLVRDAERLDPLVYKPGRRWVARLDGPAGVPQLAKVHRPTDLPAVLAGYSALAGLPVPVVDRVDRRAGTVVNDWVPGVALDTVTGPSVDGLWALAGAALAEIHRQPAIDGLTTGDHVLELEDAVHGVLAVLPGVAPTARAVAERLRAALGDAQPRVVHGDFSADQVIVRGGPDGAAPDDDAPGRAVADTGTEAAVSVLDLDRVRLDDPMSDLGSWYGAHVAAAGSGAPDPEELLAPLLAGYTGAGGLLDARLLRLHCAAGVLRRAAEPFRRHTPDWPDAVAALVGSARELAAP
ncbi:phosphotransferase [Georgenia sp. Z1491]|uniref:phosphotransferase n=1 Tax=Georgenia sp. Z1491 TaxID=3416707 RepID=UPI003CEC9147